MTNDELFDRFLDGVELYLELRREYKNIAQRYYDVGDYDFNIEDNLRDREELLFQQRSNMQKILEEIISNGINNRQV